MKTNYFDQDKMLLRKKPIQLLGQSFKIMDESGKEILFSKLKALKLKEDIRVYDNEEMVEGKEVLNINARNVIDFSATYDVSDPKSKKVIGALRRKGFKSMFKDEWIILDPKDNEIGIIAEDSVLMATIRRFVLNMIPQTFEVKIGEEAVGTFKQQFNPFVMKIEIDLSPDKDKKFDRRLAVASAILMAAIEGRQS